MPLSNNEVEHLIEKLRDKYHEYASKHNSKFFDIYSFEERLQMALRNRMNLEAFILAEVSNFEKIKQKYDQMQNQTSFTDKVDKIIEKQLENIKKYPYVDFHPRAGVEIKHIYGILIELSNYYFPIFWAIIQDPSYRNKLHLLEEELSELAVPRRNNLSKKIEDYFLLISRNHVTELEIEKSQNNFLKESAFILHKINDFCDDIINSNESSLEVPIHFAKAFFSPDRKRKITDIFSHCTGYGAILKVQELVKEILADFRLTAFKQRI